MITVESNKICYIFDVDGTLTEPRKLMDSKFAKEFSLWAQKKQCFIATGSDFEKIKQQIPESVLSSFENIFCCMGNEIRNNIGEVIHKSKFVIPDSLDQELAEILKNSKYPIRAGNHIEFRTGISLKSRSYSVTPNCLTVCLISLS